MLDLMQLFSDVNYSDATWQELITNMGATAANCNVFRGSGVRFMLNTSFLANGASSTTDFNMIPYSTTSLF